MNREIESVLDNYEISKEEYYKIYEYLKKMESSYIDGDGMTEYNYEAYVSEIVGPRFAHYSAEAIAIELYRLGEFKEIINNEIYKGNKKVLSELRKI